jgi:hypothetical protein
MTGQDGRGASRWSLGETRRSLPLRRMLIAAAVAMLCAGAISVTDWLWAGPSSS